MHAQPVVSPRGSLSVIVSLALLATLLGGCATVHQVKVDAIRNPDPSLEAGPGYQLVGRYSAQETNDPDFPRLVGLMRNALAAHGMYDATELGDPSVVVEVDFGVGPERMKVSTREVPPEWRSFEPDQPTLFIREDGTRELHLGHVVVIAEPVSEKYLSIVARQAPTKDSGAETGAELWRVQVSLESHGNEIAEVLPVLVGAATDEMGSDTGGAGKTIRLTKKAPVVEFVCADL